MESHSGGRRFDPVHLHKVSTRRITGIARSSSGAEGKRIRGRALSGPLQLLKRATVRRARGIACAKDDVHVTVSSWLSSYP
jgi:hypothetical protein